MDKTRRGFLKSLGAGAGATAAAVLPAAPKVEEEVIKVPVYEHELVKVEHFLLRGDGTQEGDIAMLQIEGEGWRRCVLANGRWRKMFDV